MTANNRHATSEAARVNPVLTTAELLAFVPIGKTLLAAKLASGELPSLKIGRRRLVRRADLARWLGVAEHDLLPIRDLAG